MITSAFSAVKAATDVVKFIRDSDVSLGKAEMNMKLAELISALADIKMQMAEVREELLKKDEIIADLHNQLKTRGQLKFEMPYYWQIDGESKIGPYCQSCQDNDHKLTRLVTTTLAGLWECKVCKNECRDRNYRVETY